MKRTLFLTALYLALAAARGYAREPLAPPSPTANDTAPRVGRIKQVPHPIGIGSIFYYVGHYGESIRIPHDWAADAEMRGLTEIVYFHRKTTDGDESHPFQPKASDYKPENFSPLQLMELVVIPKNAPGGLRSLKALRRAKEDELRRNGVEYKVSEERSSYDALKKNFLIAMKRPYRVNQAYGETAKEFYILTTGDFLEPGDYGFSADNVLGYNNITSLARESLDTHFMEAYKEGLGAFLFTAAPADPGDALRSFRAPRFRAIYGSLGAVTLFLALWKGAHPRARLFGLSLLLIAHLPALAVFLAIYLPIRLGGMMWRSVNDATLVPVLLIPWSCWFVARRLRSGHTKRVLIATGTIAALWVFLVFYGRGPDNELPIDYTLFGSTMIFHLAAMVLAVAFAVAVGPIHRKGENR